MTNDDMTAEKLLEASDTLSWLSDHLNGLGPDVRKSALLGLSCTIINTVCVQMAYQMQRGADAITALEQVAPTVDMEAKTNDT